MNDSDFFICAAFRELLVNPSPEYQEKITPKTANSIAQYLSQLPAEDRQNPPVMANHITAFCQQPENEELYEWLGEIYDRLDTDGIDTLVKKTGDPSDEADSESIAERMLYNESRDICDDLQKWADEQEKDSGNKNDTQ